MSSITTSRFLNIDALRGIAAFLVVIFHAFGSTSIFNQFLSIENLNPSNTLYFIPAFGYSGVYLFFVISGFCIHLRWVKAKAKGIESPKIDLIAFWKRRWIRLYPAYIAAIAVFLSWQYHQGNLVFNGFFIWDMVSHLLMIHNFDNRTVYSMNGVFWTLAIEEQLYLLYFLLLYLRRKWGWKITLAICFIARFFWLGVSLSITKLTGFELPFSEGTLAVWWIWALGALAVENYFKITKLPGWCSSVILSTAFLFAAAAIHYTAFATAMNNLLINISIVFEPLFWGAGFFFLINYIMTFEGKWTVSSLKYQLITACAFVGVFSYSLYLTHELLLQSLVMLNGVILSVLSLIFAYFFFLVFEKPFMSYLVKDKS